MKRLIDERIKTDECLASDSYLRRVKGQKGQSTKGGRMKRATGDRPGFKRVTDEEAKG